MGRNASQNNFRKNFTQTQIVHPFSSMFTRKKMNQISKLAKKVVVELEVEPEAESDFDCGMEEMEEGPLFTQEPIVEEEEESIQHSHAIDLVGKRSVENSPERRGNTKVQNYVTVMDA